LHAHGKLLNDVLGSVKFRKVFVISAWNRRIMRKIIVSAYLLVITLTLSAQSADSLMFRKIYDEVLSNGACYDWLHSLCKDVGHRLSGSPQADMAVRWGEAAMKEAGFDTVWLQPVTVPKWVRGQKEYGEILGVGQVDILALGGSIATPSDGITANVIYVADFAALEKLGKSNIQGKIVFFDEYYDPTNINTFISYGQCVPYRSKGASEAAKYGAVAVIIRSVTPAFDDYPHTGNMNYQDGVTKIPAVAISTVDAERLKTALKNNQELQFRLVTYSQTLESVPSFNVVGELTGTEFPNEVIVVGGHLDSWDVGEGAHDDGAGCVQSMEVLRTIQALQGRPKRTIRCVLYMNEENGNKGGHAYADWAATQAEKHILAFESDAGGFSPRGFGIDGDAQYVPHFQQLLPWLAPYNIHHIQAGWGGVDIGPLKENGTLLLGLVPDSQRYMDYHHTANDTFDKVNKRELELGAATMTSVVWWVSEHGLPALK
jgi:carboxypeptidase Q